MDPPEEGHQTQPQPEKQLEQQQEQTTINIDSPVTDEETTKRIKSFKIYHYCLMIVIALLITNVYFNLYWDEDQLDLVGASFLFLFYSLPVVYQLLLGPCFTSDKSILIQSLRSLSKFQVVFYLIMTFIVYIPYVLSHICLSGFYGVHTKCDNSRKGLFFGSLLLFSFICFINSCCILISTTNMVN